MNTNDTAFTPLPGSQKRPIALITGASRGIGAAIARTFAQAGYDLILTCIRNEDKLKKLCQELSDSCSICAVPFCGDMGDFDTVTRLFSTIRRLDVLVNNAGISHIGLLSDMTPEEWRRLMATNLDACFYTCRLAVPLPGLPWKPPTPPPRARSTALRKRLQRSLRPAISPSTPSPAA